MADLRIDLAAEFRGRKAFKEADKAVSGLDRAVGKLGKQLASVFAAQKIYAFGKASVKAFVDDQAAAAKLAKTVDNLGLAFANPEITSFISNLEKQSGVLDDVLRPAYQALLTTTGDYVKSQKLLAQAIDISRGSGVDLATVTQDLSNAYVGITKGLKKYNLGLTQAQLKGKSFEELMVLLNKQFDGASAAYLETYAGKLSILSTAAANAQEIIGQGLVDALISLTGENTDVQDLADSMLELATYTADFARGLGKIGSGIKNFPVLKQFFDLVALSARTTSPASLIANLGKKDTGGYGDYAGSVEEFKRTQNEKAAARAKAIADKKARDIANSQLKIQKQLTEDQKKQAALKKAGTVFDMEQIQLIAALKGDLSKEERTRAEAMLALLNENDVLATNLTKQILLAQDKTGGLYQYFLSIGDVKVKNPFAFLDDWIVEFQKKLDGLKMPNFAAVAPTSGAVQNFVPDVVYPVNPKKPGDSGFIGPVIPDTNVPAGSGSWNGFSGGISNLNNGTANQIELKISGDSALTKAIADSLQVQSLSGIPSSVQRLVSTFG